ncbi:MAG: ABC transporter substrate-binding protein, partial [Mesorhizobium sp.]
TPPGDVPYAVGTLMIAPPEWSQVADPKIVQAFSAKNIVPDGYTLPSYAAVEVAKAALTSAESSGQPLGEALTGHDFATAIGTIRFDDKGDLSQNPFRLFRFDGTHFVQLEDK